MSGTAVILAGQLSALGALGAAAVVVAVCPVAARVLVRAWDLYGPGARRRAPAVRARLHQLLATEPQRPDRAALTASAARLTTTAHARHAARLPAQRTPKD